MYGYIVSHSWILSQQYENDIAETKIHGEIFSTHKKACEATLNMLSEDIYYKRYGRLEAFITNDGRENHLKCPPGWSLERDANSPYPLARYIYSNDDGLFWEYADYEISRVKWADDRDGMYFVWSTEHNGWWKPNSSGYTKDVTEAGIYSQEDAERIVMSSTTDARYFQEVMVSCDHVIEMIERLEESK